MTLDRPILIVEDDAAIRDILAIVVGEELGAAVALARDGTEAIARARALRPAAVVLDLMLPQIDGFEVARRLKADHVTADTWILAVSAGGPAMASAARNAGCDAFLAKPFEVEHLVQLLTARLQAGAIERADDDGKVIRFRGSI